MSHGKPGRTYPTPPAAKDRRVIGHPVTRLEDRPLVTGQGRYAGDINFVISFTCASSARRSPMAKSTASMPAPRWRCPASSRCGPMPTSRRCRRSISAPTSGRVAHALPAAGAGAAAACAMSAIRSPPCLPRTPISPKTPPNWCDSISRSCRSSSQPSDKPGEFDAGLHTEPDSSRIPLATSKPRSNRARTSSNSTSSIGRHSGVPLETRGAIGRYDAARDLLELHGAAKIPHRNRETLCRMLDRSPIGAASCSKAMSAAASAFAAKSIRKTCWCCVAAMRLGRPVKWIEDRREHLMCRQSFRQQRHIARIAFDDNGTHPRHRGRILSRPGRLCPHPRRARAEPHDVHAPRPYNVPAYRGDRRISA